MDGINSYNSTAAAAVSSQNLVGYGPEAGQASSAVRETIVTGLLNASQAMTKEDRAIFLAIADHESGFNPSAKNPHSSAHGIFQIIDKTWNGLGRDSNERNNAELQIAAGVRLFNENLRYLRIEGKSALHGEARAIELYRLHHDGQTNKDRGGVGIARQYVIPKFNLYVKLLRDLQ